MKIIISSVILILIVLGSQHCAKVQFAESPSYEADVELQSGNGNGGIYTGSFRVADLHDECVDSDIYSEIEQVGSNFYLLREACQDMNRVEVEPLVIEPELIVVVGRIFVESTQDYQQLVQHYPQSCQEIFDSGRANGNGYYHIRRDGQGNVTEEFCNIEFISGGWTPWSSWTPCSQSCGGGTQQRTRSCQALTCSGEAVEERSCNTDGC